MLRDFKSYMQFENSITCRKKNDHFLWNFPLEESEIKNNVHHSDHTFMLGFF